MQKSQAVILNENRFVNSKVHKTFTLKKHTLISDNEGLKTNQITLLLFSRMW